jgi:hypothetical protein
MKTRLSLNQRDADLDSRAYYKKIACSTAGPIHPQHRAASLTAWSQMRNIFTVCIAAVRTVRDSRPGYLGWRSHRNAKVFIGARKVISRGR